MCNKNLGRDRLIDKKDNKDSFKRSWSFKFKLEYSIFSLYHKVKNSIIKKYEKTKIANNMITSRELKEFDEFKFRENEDLSWKGILTILTLIFWKRIKS